MNIIVVASSLSFLIFFMHCKGFLTSTKTLTLMGVLQGLYFFFIIFQKLTEKIYNALPYCGCHKSRWNIENLKSKWDLVQWYLTKVFTFLDNVENKKLFIKELGHSFHHIECGSSGRTKKWKLLYLLLWLRCPTFVAMLLSSSLSWWKYI